MCISKTGHIWMRFVDCVNVNIQNYYTTVLQNIEGNGSNSIWDLSILLLTSTCESTIISTKSSTKNKTTQTHLEREYRRFNMHMNTWLHSSFIREIKLKVWCYNTAFLPEWQRCKRLTIPSVGEDTDNKNSHTLPVGV